MVAISIPISATENYIFHWKWMIDIRNTGLGLTVIFTELLNARFKFGRVLWQFLVKTSEKPGLDPTSWFPTNLVAPSWTYKSNAFAALPSSFRFTDNFWFSGIFRYLYFSYFMLYFEQGCLVSFLKNVSLILITQINFITGWSSVFCCNNR